MFSTFFYSLKEAGIPVSPTAFLTLHRAMDKGLVNSLSAFYTASRSILIKSERHFDRFDQVFAHHFQGADMPDVEDMELDAMARSLLDEWLKNPQVLANTLDIDEDDLAGMSPEELIEYFKERLKDQTGAHHGGGKWIGTGGTSPVGHSGYHPGGMRVGGVGRNRSAVKVAMDRRYKDYRLSGPLTRSMMGEALKRLRHLVPHGPRDRLDVNATIYQTTRNGGEIDIVFDRSLKDRLKVILALDNGGWSMDPYISLVQTLFDYADNQFKDLCTYFFHNTIYDVLWEDPARYKKPTPLSQLVRKDPRTRFILVGDAAMAPYELMAADGSIHVEKRTGKPSIEQLRFLAKTFPHIVWLNPVPENQWGYTHTIDVIRRIFPMFPLTLDGLERAVSYLMKK